MTGISEKRLATTEADPVQTNVPSNTTPNNTVPNNAIPSQNSFVPNSVTPNSTAPNTGEGPKNSFRLSPEESKELLRALQQLQMRDAQPGAQL